MTNAPCRLGLTEVIVGVPFPISALEIARNELAPKSFRTMLATGETFGPEEALARGIVDELAAPDELLPRAHAKALELAALPAQGFAAIKQQQRGRALKRMAQAVDDGAEPQLGGWLSDEARKAAAAILGGGSK